MSTPKTAVAFLTFALTLLLAACNQEASKSGPNATPSGGAQTATAPAPTPPTASAPAPATGGSTSNCLAPPFLVSTTSGKYAYTVPRDFALTRQADANCFAWQEFIALNWTASPTRATRYLGAAEPVRHAERPARHGLGDL